MIPDTFLLLVLCVMENEVRWLTRQESLLWTLGRSMPILNSGEDIGSSTVCPWRVQVLRIMDEEHYVTESTLHRTVRGLSLTRRVAHSGMPISFSVLFGCHP